MKREHAEQLVARLVKMSKADELSVSISGGTTTHLRFARNNPSTSGSFEEIELELTSSFGSRSASTRVNQLDDASLERGLRLSEEMARLSPEDPEHVDGLGPTEYPEVAGFDQETAERGDETIAAGAGRCLSEAAKAGLVAAGFTQITAGFSCIANSRGMFGYHRGTSAFASETVRTADGRGSGWASDASFRAGDLDYARLSATARDKAKRSAGPKPLAPGRYVTILEPACVASLVSNMVGAMRARPADEGRSFFSKKGGGNRLGERLFNESITIRSDPADSRAPGSPWGSEGLPQAPRAWIETGKLATLARSRYWAKKQGAEAVPGPANILMAGGGGSVEDLVASTERGVLVTSLWYIRTLDPRTLTYTGLTRDGVFWIEDGKIRHPVTNFRWNDSPIAMLKGVMKMSRPVRVPPRPGRRATVVVPALKVRAFNFASVSDAV